MGEVDDIINNLEEQKTEDAQRLYDDIEKA